MLDIEGRLDAIPRYSARTFYVDATNGAATNTGHAGNPLLTIGAALALVAAGDRIVIARGGYDEAVVIPAGLVGLEVICEPGVILSNTTPGTVVSIAANYAKWSGGIAWQAGQTGFSIGGAYVTIKDAKAYTCATAFAMTGTHVYLHNCNAIEYTTTGFDILGDHNRLWNCNAFGTAATRGFYLSGASADENLLCECNSVNNTAAGYETVAGASNNLFAYCNQSSLCAGPTDGGANNTWATHSQDSQIAAGNTLQQDLKDIYDKPGGVTIAAFASGTQTAVITTEHFLSNVNVAGIFQLVLDTSNMVAGDVLEVRVYQMVLTLGTARVVHFSAYYGEQSDEDYVKVSPLVVNELTDAQSLRFSIQQTFGTGRAFPWKVLQVS